MLRRSPPPDSGGGRCEEQDSDEHIKQEEAHNNKDMHEQCEDENEGTGAEGAVAKAARPARQSQARGRSKNQGLGGFEAAPHRQTVPIKMPETGKAKKITMQKPR